MTTEQNTVVTNATVEAIIGECCYISSYGYNDVPGDLCRNHRCSTCEGHGYVVEVETTLFVCACGAACEGDVYEENADGSITYMCSYCDAVPGRCVDILDEDSDLASAVKHWDKDVLILARTSVKKPAAVVAA